MHTVKKEHISGEGFMFIAEHTWQKSPFKLHFSWNFQSLYCSEETKLCCIQILPQFKQKNSKIQFQIRCVIRISECLLFCVVFYGALLFSFFCLIDVPREIQKMSLRTYKKLRFLILYIYANFRLLSL